MDKLSRPYQIALGAMVVLALAWFTVLKPSDTAAEEATPAPVAATPAAAVPPSGPTAAAPVPAPSAAAATRPITGRARPKTVPGDPSAPILRDVADGKVAVLLFFSREAADDRSVRRSLLAADRHNGRVVVRAASIARVAKYAAITEGVDVLQAPTVLVIGKDMRARALVGFTDTRAIDQLVSDVGGPNFQPRRFKGYRGRVENLCAVVTQSFGGDVLNGQDAAERLAIVRDDLVDARRAAVKLDPPRRYAAFQRRFEENLALGVSAYGAALKAQRAGQNPVAAFAAYVPRVEASNAKLQRAAARAGLSKGC